MNRNREGGPYTSGELAALLGVSADTIRHYERLGLLAKPARTEGGYRQYPAETQVRVQTVRCAVKAGFGLKELADIFKERDAGGAPCQRVAGMASEKIKALKAQIAELTKLHKWLVTTRDEWRRTLNRTPPGQPAGLLESLTMQWNSAQKHTTKGRTNEKNRSRVTPLHSDRSPGAKRRVPTASKRG
jgi:MerR family transcriptional regulator, mercuric resistance operon regulatory protein